jgi:hypothetical protein
MSKKTILNLAAIRQLPTHKTEVVEVPEFGVDEQGEPLVVHVRGLTVKEQHAMNLYLFDLRPNANGKGYQESRRPGADAAFYFTAVCAQDDEGNMVFGETAVEAIETVSNLPIAYREAINRIALAAIRLSGKADALNGTGAVSNAEKN